jgi:hypothetical protein
MPAPDNKPAIPQPGSNQPPAPAAPIDPVKPDAGKLDPQSEEKSGDEPKEKAKAYSEQVTYLPQPGDPASVEWGGKKFHANTPQTLKAHAEGNPPERAAHDLIEKARKNKYFKVGNFNAKKDSVEVDEQPSLPRTPEQYRAWAVQWFQKVGSVEELDRRWQGEEKLRQDCGVGTDDLDYLRDLYEPRRYELRKAGSI